MVSLIYRKGPSLTVIWSICDHGWMTRHSDDGGAAMYPNGSGPADAPHPGLFLRREIIASRGLSVDEAAEALRVLRPTGSAS